MATLYYNASVDANWATLGNWWMDSDHTVPATALPGSGDDVIATADIYSNSGSTPTVANFTISNAYLEIDIVVSGVATLNSVTHNQGLVTGNATYNGSSQISSFGATGHMVLNDNSFVSVSNSLTSFLSLTCNDYSYVDAIYTTNPVTMVFNDFSACRSGTDLFVDNPAAEITFNDMSVLGDTFYRRDEGGPGIPQVNGTLRFYDDALMFCVQNFYGAALEFHDNAYNATGAGPYPDSTVLLKPSRGINGSSILGVI